MMTDNDRALVRAAIEAAGREASAEVVDAVESEFGAWWTRLDWLTPGELTTATWVALAEVEREGSR